MKRIPGLDHRERPICPHCGHHDRDAWEIDFSRNETKTVACNSCGKDYRVTQHLSVTYSTGLVE